MPRMVGVPRSKACNTCKQRKVLVSLYISLVFEKLLTDITQCSLEKPHCRTCIKASRDCLGYERDTIFIHDTRTSGGAPTSYRKMQQAKDVTNVPKQVDKWFDAAEEAEGAPRFGLSTSVITKIILPSTHSVYGQQLLSNFLSSSNLGSKSMDQNERGLAGSWFEMLPTLPGMTTALEISALAISTASMGRANGDISMVHESRRLYTKGLRELQRALWSRSLMYKAETCAACVALVIYEIIECPDQVSLIPCISLFSELQNCCKNREFYEVFHLPLTVT